MVVGRIRAELVRLGLDGNTVIIYTSDNGYFLGERGYADKWLMYDLSIRVPLVVYDPRAPRESRGPGQAGPGPQHRPRPDHAWTWPGSRSPRCVQGRSLKPLLGRATPAWRTEIFCEELWDHPEIPRSECVRTDRWKYIQYPAHPEYVELFDLEDDPDEKRNLAGDPGYARVLAELRARCDGRIRRLLDDQDQIQMTNELSGRLLLTRCDRARGGAGAPPGGPAGSRRSSRTGRPSPDRRRPDLRCEYRVDPLGIDAARPRLSWILESPARAVSPERLSDPRRPFARGARGRSGRSLGQRTRSRSAESLSASPTPARRFAAGSAAIWKVRVWDGRGRPSAWSPPAVWEMALLGDPEDWTGRWIDDGKPVPEARRGFLPGRPGAALPQGVRRARSGSPRARLYITGLGYYEASINGPRVGDQVLDPGWTNYGKRVFYSIYDVTGLLRAGANCLGVMLGNGWYNPLPLRMWGEPEPARGPARRTAPSHRPAGDRGRGRLGDDRRDRRRTGRSAAARSCATTSISARSTTPAARSRAGTRPGATRPAGRRPSPAPARPAALQAQPQPPIRVTARSPPGPRDRARPGVLIFDLGRNFAGWARLAPARARRGRGPDPLRRAAERGRDASTR